MSDKRRRIPASTIKSLLRRLEALYVLCKRDEIDRATARLISLTAESAYRDLFQAVPWLEVERVKRSDEIKSAARSAGLATHHRGNELSVEVLGYRLKCMSRYAESDRDTAAPPAYWFDRER